MLKIIAIIGGIIFLIVGILGFIPGLAPHGELTGVFRVNFMHNVVHLITGIVAIWCGMASERAARAFFIIFGIIYGIVAILGFIQGEGFVFGMIAVNMADNWLHLVIAIVALCLGFGCRGSRSAASK